MLKKRIETKWGDAVLCNDGYYKISNKSKKYGGKLLHRLIYEEYSGETLGSNIIIHHIDGNKLNNTISNLTPMTITEHMQTHQLGENNNNYGGLTFKNKIGISNRTNTTGIFRVSKHNKKDVTQGFAWVYQYYENGKRKHFSSVDIHKLEKKVKSNGLEWVILDEEKANEILGVE